jgi:hypothetical protein
MLAAYRGEPVDVTPVAPEFWYYYPARVLGVSMMEFEREVPFWKGLQETFTRYRCEGWGVAFAMTVNEHKQIHTSMHQVEEERYEENSEITWKGKTFTTKTLFDVNEPSWTSEPMVKGPQDVSDYVDMELSPDNTLDFSDAVYAHGQVGDDYLLEFWLGVPFFDFFEQAMGFEPAVIYFLSADEKILEAYQERYIAYQKKLVQEAVEKTPFESFVIGCSSSCNSLIGPDLWRKWDKPYIKAIADEVHRQGRLLHVHFHGKSMETVEDFAEIGIDCVCPFERPPGGDVEGEQGLREVRRRLGEKVTVNGNVHTIETLIRGTPDDVRREVREILDAFEGSNRIIVGSGDQVGRETPEENLMLMIDEARTS